MAQATGNSTRAVDSLSDRNDKTLQPNQSVVQREDGAVLLTTVTENGSITRRRLDSEGDLDHAAKGGIVWWKTLLKQQADRDKASAPKKAAKKVTSND